MTVPNINSSKSFSDTSCHSTPQDNPISEKIKKTFNINIQPTSAGSFDASTKRVMYPKKPCDQGFLNLATGRVMFGRK